MLRGDRRGERREFSLRADGPAVINRLHVPRLEATFAGRDYDDWRQILTDDFAGEWVSTQSPHEIVGDLA